MTGPAKQLKGRAARLARMMPAGATSAARTPFVLLVVLLLGGGLITLLLLNSSLNEGSFRLSELKKQTTDLTDEQQALQRDVDDHSAPDALGRRARELGMVPGGNPAFLNPDGSVRGVPEQAEALPPVRPSVLEQPPPASPPPGSTVPVPLPSPAASAADPSATATEAPRDPAASAPVPTPGDPAPTTSGR
ncbi:cell division protein FtsL [Streptomyces liangshanensis]|uniref:Cell division protein FtsL n=1 Tax=Streptomyces liangshanensis TaxID=2717324 RepID=A0A6G9H3W5_9ACTN|nr:cell division protein FtsL [Streptomyces liangshanensis]QIQ05205.1 cell division protein FtsL [Streptomyces liangshanensis]